jgi:hypothetical protein
MNRRNFADKRCVEGISGILKGHKWRDGSFVFRMKEVDRFLHKQNRVLSY